MRHHCRVDTDLMSAQATGPPSVPATVPLRLRRPPPADAGGPRRIAAITAVKGTVIALAVDAFLNSNEPRYHGKGMRLRAIGYAGGLLIAPVAWRLRGRRPARAPLTWQSLSRCSSTPAETPPACTAARTWTT